MPLDKSEFIKYRIERCNETIQKAEDDFVKCLFRKR
jgi:hypothetical protein